MCVCAVILWKGLEETKYSLSCLFPQVGSASFFHVANTHHLGAIVRVHCDWCGSIMGSAIPVWFLCHGILSAARSCLVPPWLLHVSHCHGESVFISVVFTVRLVQMDSVGSLLLQFWLGRFVPSAELVAVILCSPLWGGGKGQKGIFRCFEGENQGSAQDVYNRSPDQFSLEAVGLLGNMWWQKLYHLHAISDSKITSEHNFHKQL